MTANAVVDLFIYLFACLLGPYFVVVVVGLPLLVLSSTRANKRRKRRRGKNHLNRQQSSARQIGAQRLHEHITFETREAIHATSPSSVQLASKMPRIWMPGKKGEGDTHIFIHFHHLSRVQFNLLFFFFFLLTRRWKKGIKETKREKKKNHSAMDGQADEPHRGVCVYRIRLSLFCLFVCVFF